MYVFSYYMIVAFHPDLKIPRLIVYRGYDQDQQELQSLTHFQVLEYDFFNDRENFNKLTLKQLQDASFSVFNREKPTALAEMFSIDLKFTVDCLKFWFQKNHKIIELDVDEKDEFKRNNLLTKQTLCCLCNFPIEPRAENGWAQHVFKAEHLFLENIYSKKQMDQMGIKNFETFSLKLNKILDNADLFCQSLESESYWQENNGNDEIENIIDKIKKIKTTQPIDDKNRATKEKTITYLYQHSICFIKTNKIKGEIPISNKFLSNMYAISKNRKVIHHSQVTGKIIGFAHDFCNQRCRENYYTIPVFAHNQFRFDFFIFLKGIRLSVWETFLSVGKIRQM